MPKPKKSDNIEFAVTGRELVRKVEELIKEGNSRKIIIKNDKGTPLIEIPLTIGVVGTVFAPVLAAVGTIAALVSNCTIEVIKK